MGNVGIACIDIVSIFDPFSFLIVSKLQLYLSSFQPLISHQTTLLQVLPLLLPTTGLQPSHLTPTTPPPNSDTSPPESYTAHTSSPLPPPAPPLPSTPSPHP